MKVMYGIPNCDTIRKARTWLDTHGVDYSFHDYRKAGIDAATLKRWADKVGWETLLNRGGTTFRALPEGDKAALDRARALALMQAQPSMINRPVLVHEGGIEVGFKPEHYAARFG